MRAMLYSSGRLVEGAIAKGNALMATIEIATRMNQARYEAPGSGILNEKAK